MSQTVRPAPVVALPSVSGVVCSRRPKVYGIGAFASVGVQQRLARFWLEILVDLKKYAKSTLFATEEVLEKCLHHA